MSQWLGLDPLAAFALRRIEARGWQVSVQCNGDQANPQFASVNPTAAIK
jgi:hypothetical protein